MAAAHPGRARLVRKDVVSAQRPGGYLPRFLPDQSLVRETTLGLVPEDHISTAQRAEPEDTVQPSFFNGASSGLAIPRIQGNEPVRLFGMDPSGEIGFELPGNSPRISISLEGQTLDVSVHIQTVWIQKDKDRLTMIWSGNAPTPRMLPLTLPTREEPMVDELEGVEVKVDGREIHHEPMNLGKAPF